MSGKFTRQGININEITNYIINKQTQMKWIKIKTNKHKININNDI